MANGRDKDVDGLLRNRTALTRLLFQVTKVITVTSTQAQKTGAVGQIIQKLIQALAGRAHKCRQSKYVKIADTIVMRQTSLRTHAQAVTARVAFLNGT